MAAGWRYLATRLNGDGTETFLSNDVPLQGAALTEDLSGPGGIKGSINPEVERLLTSAGEPIFVPWSTAIYAEKDDHIRAGAILANLTESGPSLALDCVGFTGYLKDQPYTGDISRIKADPLDLARHLWQHKQGIRGGNLGLALDPTTSPVRVGTPAVDKKIATETADVEFASGPFTLAWWKDHDMGQAFDDLAVQTPFDYLVTHQWSGESIRHQLRLGYPTLGRRLTDLRFVLGENIFEIPDIDYAGAAYASEVVVLGAGQGRAMVRGGDARVPTRLHRAVVVEDKALTSKVSANRVARLEVAARLGDPDLDEFTVVDHPNAQIGAFNPGDEILVQTRDGWGQGRAMWVRILSIQITPEKDQATLTVARVEKLE